MDFGNGASATVTVQPQLAKIAQRNEESKMRRVVLGLLTALVLFPAAPRAEDSPARACDLAAASPTDPTRPSDIPGVRFGNVDAKVAVPACKAALAADPENARLLFQMGRALQASYDYGQARIHFEKAAAKGHPGARQDLAVFYMGGSGGLPKSDEDAARLLKLAADQGLALAQFTLGGFYEAGRGGLPKSDTEAARLYKLAADQGEPHGLVRLASLYATGRGGLQKNASEASRLCNLAADKDPTVALPQCWILPRWMTEYTVRIAQMLEQHKRFPTAALSQGAHGTVILDFVIDRQGRVTYGHVRQSSGWAVLDNEALSILQRSQPFPALPDKFPDQRLSASVPVRFEVRSCTLNLLQPGASKTGCMPVR